MPRHADVAHGQEPGAGDPPDLHRPRSRRHRAPDALERKLYVIRRRSANAIQRAQAQARQEFYMVSMLGRTVIYKGPAAGRPGRRVLPRPADKRCVSALALVHQRFSTNTFPKWPSPTRSGWSRTTARSTPSGAITTGCARAARRDGRRCWATTCRKLAADLPRPVRHRHLRQRARTAGDGRLPARPRDDDDDPEAWEQHARWTSAAAPSTSTTPR